MIILVKYGVQDTITFPMMKAGTRDFAQVTDWTPATGDVKFTLDGSGVANAANLPVNVGGAGSGLWSFTVHLDEVTGKQCTYQIVDAPTKAVDDQAIMIRTYGHASAYYPFDLGAALTPATIAAVVNGVQAESYHVHGSNATPAQLQYAIYAFLVNMVKDSTTMTVRKQDGTTAMVLTLNHPTNPTDVARTA